MAILATYLAYGIYTGAKAYNAKPLVETSVERERGGRKKRNATKERGGNLENEGSSSSSSNQSLELSS